MPDVLPSPSDPPTVGAAPAAAPRLPPVPPVAPRGEPRRRGGCGWFAAGVLTAVLVIGGAALAFGGLILAAYVYEEDAFVVSKPPPIRQEWVEGDMTVKEKIAVVDVKGVIRGGSMMDGATSERVCAELRAAGRDPAVVAVVLDMDTPGGEVTASDEIHQAVLRLRDAGKPVVTCMRSMGASGGYYIAAASDCIVANRLTLTGSIGVIMHGINYAGLLDKIGVKDETYKSGNMKDMLNGGRARTPEEIEYTNALVRQSFLAFAGVVAAGRSRHFTSRDQVLQAPFADGRVLSGEDAFQAHLVDELGYFADAIRKARELGKVPNAKVVRFHRELSLGEFLLSMQTPVRLSLLSGMSDPEFRPRPGQLYYILPASLR